MLPLRILKGYKIPFDLLPCYLAYSVPREKMTAIQKYYKTVLQNSTRLYSRTVHDCTPEQYMTMVQELRV